jgi:hypothetical protein
MNDFFTKKFFKKILIVHICKMKFFFLMRKKSNYMALISNYYTELYIKLQTLFIVW